MDHGIIQELIRTQRPIQCEDMTKERITSKVMAYFTTLGLQDQYIAKIYHFMNEDYIHSFYACNCIIDPLLDVIKKQVVK